MQRCDAADPRAGCREDDARRYREAADVPSGTSTTTSRAKTTSSPQSSTAQFRASTTRSRCSIATERRRHGSRHSSAQLADRRDLIAQFGCPQGSLCTELEKGGGHDDVSRLMTQPMAWLEEQFGALGRKDAHDLAISLLVSYQGTAVLTHTLRDPSLLADAGKRLERWIDSL